MNTYDPTETRLQLFRNGYTPIPNLNKEARFTGFNSLALAQSLTPDIITAWWKQRRDLKATGLQVRNGLMPIDFDITDEDVIEEMLTALELIVGKDAYDRMPWRTGNYPKLMVFARWDGLKEWTGERIHGIESTGKYIDAAGNKHMIEVFGGALSYGGAATKQVGVYGPHSHEKKPDGEYDLRKVICEYTWETSRPTLLNTRLEDLPGVTPGQMWGLMQAFWSIATTRGWTKVADPAGQAKKREYDITPDTPFTLQYQNDKVTYADLDENMRVSASFIDGREHDSPDRCHVRLYKPLGILSVLDYHTGTWHLPIELKPPTLEEHNEELATQLRRLEAMRPPPGKTAPAKPTSNDFSVWVDWLLQTHAFFAGADKVVELYQPNDRCFIGKDAFRTEYASWREEVVGPRSGKRAVLATGAWEINAKRPSVRGARLRPDQDFPLYEEDGDVYKNTYRRPQHFGAGGLAPFTAFLERFIPDAREREWLLDWMAHKQRRPEIPGTSIWFVADSDEDTFRVGRYGTGRGIMFSIAALLYGPDYYTAQDFDVISGASGQSAYNDWLHYSVLATVDEAATSPTAHRRGERRSTYEVLKNVIDPAPKPRTFRPKYGKIFTGMSYCSLWVATNHANAAAIPATDRRITVLRNGAEMTPEEALELVAWREGPGNIAALATFLEARSLDGFNMFQPLDTAGKREMAELSASPVEEILADFTSEEGRGLVFVRPHLERAIEAILAGDNMRSTGNAWRGMLDGAWATHCIVLKTAAGSPIRLRVGGSLHRVYCLRSNLRAARHLTEAQRRHHAAKWGPIDGANNPLTVIQGGLPPAE